MGNALEKVGRHASEYASSEQDTWALVKRAHDRAMLVLDIEDLVDYGLFVLSMWFRHVDQWHAEVSTDTERYDRHFHMSLKEIERTATAAAKGTKELINHAKKWGHEIAKEREFRELSDLVVGAAREPRDQFQERSFTRFRQEALKEHKAGETKEIDNWGQ